MPAGYWGSMIAKQNQWTIAYFSMEIGVDASKPTYSGGLGVLAGDTLRAAADLGLPMVGVTLIYRKGYFRQHLDAHGNQTESPWLWNPEEQLEALSPRVTIQVQGRAVVLRAWRFVIRGGKDKSVPVYFLDANLEENDPADRALTDVLYGGDARIRLAQEAVLGLGGVAMLRALGHTDIASYHMNEGHSALLTLALLEEQTRGRGVSLANEADREAIRQHCIFTTHTPVPAGHDQFPLDLVTQVLGPERAQALAANECCPEGVLNMTNVALVFSRYVNGVAMRHGEISQEMFPHYPIDSITNGVHAVTWASTSFRVLFDRFIPDWRDDNFYLRHALNIPLDEIQRAHNVAKSELLGEVERRTQVRFDPSVFTIGFARRATAYKRADLLFTDVERLKRIAQQVGPLQIIYGGKAHPHDMPGKHLIRKIFDMAKALEGVVTLVYLEEYDMTIAKQLCAGVDLWLNTPQKPHEASGTSGMKAAINGVPSFSVLDGWWIEGHIEGVTGWSIGNHWGEAEHPDSEARSLYEKLEQIILPTYYNQPERYDRIMQSTIVLNGSFFNSQRMLDQYVKNAYLRDV